MERGALWCAATRLPVNGSSRQMFLRVVLQTRLGIEQRIRGVIQLLDVIFDNECARLFESVAEIECADKRFESVGQHRRIIASPCGPHSGPEQRELREP